MYPPRTVANTLFSAHNHQSTIMNSMTPLPADRVLEQSFHERAVNSWMWRRFWTASDAATVRRPLSPIRGAQKLRQALEILLGDRRTRRSCFNNSSHCPTTPIGRDQNHDFDVKPSPPVCHWLGQVRGPVLRRERRVGVTTALHGPNFPHFRHSRGFSAAGFGLTMSEIRGDIPIYFVHHLTFVEALCRSR